MRMKCFEDKKRIVLDRRSILCGAISVALTAVLLGICLTPMSKTEKYDVVLLGDSVIGNRAIYLCDDVNVYVEKQTGLKVFNGGFGGSRMAISPVESEADCSNSWCMANLARNIGLNTWDAARASMAYADRYKGTNRQVFEGYVERLNKLSRIDFREVKVLIIEHGTNDYNRGIPIDNQKDPFDKTTFAGALRSSLSFLQGNYPDLQIVLLTPALCALGEEGYLSTEKDWGGGLLEAYVEKELEIAAEFNLDVIDYYRNSGITADNIYEYTVDGLHPNAEGIALLGDAIAAYLKGNLYENNGTNVGVGRMEETD